MPSGRPRSPSHVLKSTPSPEQFQSQLPVFLHLLFRTSHSHFTCIRASTRGWTVLHERYLCTPRAQEEAHGLGTLPGRHEEPNAGRRAHG